MVIPGILPDRGGAITPDPEPDIPTTYNITITGANSYAYAEINGTTYNTNTSQNLSLNKDTEIKITIISKIGIFGSDGEPYVKLNGTKVLSKAGTYTLIVNNNYTIVCGSWTNDYDGEANTTYGYCDITSS